MSSAKLMDIVEEIREKCLAKEEEIRQILKLAETEYRGLLCFEGNERITCQEFSARMNLSVSRGSRVIDRLFDEGYIERADLSSDRRCKNIWLTKKGNVVRRKIDEQRQLCEEKLTSEYSEAKIKKLKKELGDLISKF
ncbi:MarR family winged helix-turn-helix transcriptional regulator [Acidobacteriota bacterium]